MKYGFFVSIFFLTGAFGLSAQEIPQTGASAEMTAKFKVCGNCGMCEKRIEKAAKVDGVAFADWNVDTKILTVTFDANKVKPGRIHKAVAAAGHDTDKVKAPDDVYAELPECCRYERDDENR